MALGSAAKGNRLGPPLSFSLGPVHLSRSESAVPCSSEPSSGVDTEVHDRKDGVSLLSDGGFDPDSGNSTASGSNRTLLFSFTLAFPPPPNLASSSSSLPSSSSAFTLTLPSLTSSLSRRLIVFTSPSPPLAPAAPEHTITGPSTNGGVGDVDISRLGVSGQLCSRTRALSPSSLEAQFPPPSPPSSTRPRP